MSRGFKAQIGRYIASDYSYLFFRTTYGTKISIKAKNLALDHIETYTPSPINVDYIAHKEDEGYVAHEHTTPLEDVHDYLLDESATTF